MSSIKLAGDHPVWEIAVHLAVAGDIIYGVFCAVLFPTRCFGWDLGLNLISFWGFSYLLFYTIYQIYFFESWIICCKRIMKLQLCSLAQRL